MVDFRYADAAFLVVSRPRVNVGQHRPDKALVIVGGGVNKVSRELAALPFARGVRRVPPVGGLPGEFGFEGVQQESEMICQR